MKTFKKSMMLLTVLITLCCLSSTGFAANTGPVHALEGLWGAKYSGAPSQAVAGVMGLAFDELTQVKNQMFEGTVQNPQPLKKLGYKTIKAGDKIQMTRTGDHMWHLKHVKSGKEFNLKVVS